MKERISISLDTDLIEKMREIAKRKRISLSALFQRMVILYIEKEEREWEKGREREGRE